MSTVNNNFNSFSNYVQFCKDNKFQFIPIIQTHINDKINLFKKGGGIKIKEKNILKPAIAGGPADPIAAFLKMNNL